MKIVTDSRCVDYHSPGHPEAPQRVGATRQLLEHQDRLPVEWVDPAPVAKEVLLAIHDARHLAALESDRAGDRDTPTLPGMDAHARRAVGAALAAMDSALAGEKAFSLMRPPGHHATRDRAMGYCYLNQVAVAAGQALDRGLRVAVFDFDVHHGNGTEDILLGRDDAAYFSVHQWPLYPGTGRHHRDNCMNWPMAPHTPRMIYRDALRRALDALFEFRPDLIAVSAGFDAYRGDPKADERLEGEDYEDLGRSLAASGIPCFAVLEGGYSADLPELVLGFLTGLADL